MVQKGNDSGFVLKFLGKFDVHSHVMLQHLDRHRHVQAGVHTLVDKAPTATTYQFIYQVFTDSPACRDFFGSKSMSDEFGKKIK